MVTVLPWILEGEGCYQGQTELHQHVLHLGKRYCIHIATSLFRVGLHMQKKGYLTPVHVVVFWIKINSKLMWSSIIQPRTYMLTSLLQFQVADILEVSIHVSLFSQLFIVSFRILLLYVDFLKFTVILAITLCTSFHMWYVDTYKVQ